MKRILVALVCILLSACIVPLPDASDEAGGAGNSPEAMTAANPEAVRVKSGQAYESPTWVPGQTWTWQLDAQGIGQTSSEPTHRTWGALGAFDVEGTTYQVAYENRSNQAFPGMVFVGAQLEARTVFDNPLECRQALSCLGDQNLAATLAKTEPEIPAVPIFPLKAGKHAPVNVQIEGQAANGTLSVGQPRSLVAAGLTLECLPVQLDLTVTYASFGGLKVFYMAILDYCPGIGHFARRTLGLSAVIQGTPISATATETLIHYHYGPATTLDEVGRRFTENPRTTYSVLAGPVDEAVADGIAKAMGTSVFPARAADRLGITIRDPDGAVLTTTKGKTFLTTFNLPGTHTASVVVVAPQGIEAANWTGTFGVSMHESVVVACTPGVPQAPSPVSAACETVEFPMRLGVEQLDVKASGSNVGGGTLTVFDASGTAVKSATGTSMPISLSMRPGEANMGTWRVVWQPTASTGNSATIQVDAIDTTLPESSQNEAQGAPLGLRAMLQAMLA